MVLFHEFVGRNLRSPVHELARSYGDGFLLFQDGEARSLGPTSPPAALDRFREPATVTTRMPVAARIVGTSPQLVPLEPELKRGERILIGRGVLARIRFRDSDVSTDHAVLELEGGSWRLCDLGSSNGTAVNGRVLRDGTSVQLLGGEELSFGKQAKATFHNARTLRLAMSLSCMNFS
jgi:hypothetical protein